MDQSVSTLNLGVQTGDGNSEMSQTLKPAKFMCLFRADVHACAQKHSQTWHKASANMRLRAFDGTAWACEQSEDLVQSALGDDKGRIGVGIVLKQVR